MKVPKREKDEPLYKWIERLTVEVPIRRLDDNDLYELLHKISVESYIEGSNAAYSMMETTIKNRMR